MDGLTRTAVVVLLATLVCSACSSKAETVPKVAGKRLDVAKHLVKEAGLDHDVIGGGFLDTILPDDRWTVCEQRPIAGSSTADTESVMLVIDDECDVVGGLEGGKMPDLRGQRLDVAQIDLVRRGIGYRVFGGGGLLGVLDAGAWIVCETKPRAGVRLKVTKLYVERSC